MENLYDRIISLCDANGIRPGRLCAQLGISRSLMTDLKMGRKKGISAETAQKIASFFHVTVGHLLGQPEEDTPTQEEASDILDQVDIAFYGDFKELNEEEKEAVRDMVRVMRKRRADNERK